MTPLRVFTVDDEPLALRRLALALAEVPGVKLIGSETSSRASVSRIKELRPDVLLIDIAMPGLTGFEAVAELGEDHLPIVIFVTAYDEHALSAFEANAIDYLVKPVAIPRLRRSLARARSIVEARESGRAVQELLEVLSRIGGGTAEDEAPIGRPLEFWAYRNRAVVKVPVADLWWVAAEGDYVRLHSRNGGGLMRETLGRIADQLDPAVFLRVHRSAVVRRNQIAGLRRKPSGALVVELLCGAEIGVGRQYAKGIGDLLKKLG